LNQIASLTVDQVNSAGAFVDMGIVKQLLVPYKEQASPMEEGRSYPVYLYIDDKSGRLVGTTKIDRYLSNENLSIEVGEKVDLIILNPTQLGRNVVINQKHEGLIFNSDVNQPLKSGQSIIGYIKTVREDNKIDVVLQQQGVESIEPNAQKILSILEKNGGKLELNDKSDPELIMKKVFMSKKSFKKAIGNLYKARKIKIQDTGIVML
jgi:predicted RNA-binding protein (virulence factor B family)